jgi:hypothetical protein
MGSEWQTLNFFIYKYLKMWNIREKNYNSGKLSPPKAKSQLITHNGRYYGNISEMKPCNYVPHRLLVLW